MRLISISGLNGSGKTTLIKSLAERLFAQDQRIAVIVNEQGQTAYEPQWCETHLAAIAYLRGG